MPINAPITKNRPIATLIRWFTERKRGKVVESRLEIQHRFDGLNWRDQKKILLFCLSSGKVDREWAYSKLLHFWDNDFIPIVIEQFEKYHHYRLYLPVMYFLPIDFVLKYKDELSKYGSYYRFCYRMAIENVDYQIDRSRLTPKEYLTILYLAGKLDDDKALDILFDLLHTLSTRERCDYALISKKHIVEDDRPLVASDFIYIFTLVARFKRYGCLKAAQTFVEWDERLAATIWNSPEYKALCMDDDRSNYKARRYKITMKYIYESLPEKYKTPTVPKTFKNDKERFERLKDENEFLGVLVDKFGLEITE